MIPRKTEGLTILELLVVAVLLSLISLGFFNLHIYSQDQVFQSDRRAKVQNEISFVLEHMTKQIKGTNLRGGAIGDTINNAPLTLVAGGGGINQIRILIDFNNNGRLDPPGAGNTDKLIAYRFNNNNIVRFAKTIVHRIWCKYFWWVSDIS